MDNLNTPIENNDKPKAQKPRIFLVLKIIVGLLLAAGITLIICGGILYEGFSMMVFGGFTCLVFCIPLSVHDSIPSVFRIRSHLDFPDLPPVHLPVILRIRT